MNSKNQLKHIKNQNINREIVSANEVEFDCNCACGNDYKVLSSWFHITDRCNLRCAYCYLPHLQEDMSFETGCAAVDATLRSAVVHDYKRVKFKYGGGEPLLRFPLLKKIHQYAQERVKENQLEIDGIVLSNGTLLTENIISDIKSLDIQLMVSLDGIGGWNNIQRPYAGGRGSSDDILDAIKLSLKHGLSPHISITVTGRNAEGLPEVLEWVLEHNLSFNINFYRENELSYKHNDLKLDEDKIINGLLSAFTIIEANPPERSLLTSLTDRANLAIPHIHTCSVGQDYLVFDQNGLISKCQMKISEPLTNVNTEDPLQIILNDKNGIINLSVDEKDGCRDCDWKYWCAGGCPLETFRVTGRYDVKSPNCRIYRTIFP